MARLDTQIVTELQPFAALRDEWNELLDRSQSGSVFLAWDWLFTWWEEFGTGYKLQLLTVRDQGGCLIGIAPLCLTTSRGVYPKNSLVFLGTTAVSSEYLDIICAADSEHEVVTAIFERLCAPDRAWDCIYLTDLLDTSLVYSLFRKIAQNNNFLVKQNLSQECPYLELPDSLEEAMGGLSPQLRSTVRRKSKKLDKLGFELLVTHDAVSLDDSLTNLFNLHQKCWNAKGIQGNFRKKTIRAFHTEVAKSFLERNMLRLYCLKVEDTIIAALYAFCFKGKIFYYQSGYDPDWSACSPGTVLMWQSVADAISHNLDEFDYLRGDEYYKSLWSDQCRYTYSLIFLPPGSMKLKIYFMLKDVKKVSKALVKGCLVKLGIMRS